MRKKVIMSAFAFCIILIIGITLTSGLTAITNCTDLQALTTGEDYYLANNIDCSDTINWNGGLGFIPLSINGNTFDGKGFKISNLYENSTTDVGLFFQPVGITSIKNFTLENVNLNGVDYVGAINGLSTDLQVTISDVTVTGNIKGHDFVGGIIGDNANGGTVNRSSFSGNITGNNFVGGIIGNNGGIILESYSIGNINGNDTVGGLVGFDIGGNDVDIGNSYSTMNINGSTNVGGIIGIIYGGHVGNITNTFATGKVNGNSLTGGLAGTNDFIGDVCINSYWDINTTTQTNSNNCGTGKTTQQMHNPSTFSTWNTNIWGLVLGSYPSFNLPLNNNSPQNQNSNHLITGSGVIFDSVSSVGAGFGIFMQMIGLSLPLLLIGLAFVGIVGAFGFLIYKMIKQNIKEGGI